MRQATSLLLQLAKSLGITIFYRRTCDKRRCGGRPACAGTYGGHGIVFRGRPSCSLPDSAQCEKPFLALRMKSVIFEMQQVGLVEVENPSEYMLNGRPEGASGFYRHLFH